MKMKKLFVSLLPLLALLIANPLNASSVPRLDRLSTSVPQHFTVGPNQLLTSTTCFASEFTYDAHLQAWPKHGSLPGAPATIGSVNNDSDECNTYHGLAADDLHVYYHDYDNNFLARRPLSAPHSETVLVTLPADAQITIGRIGKKLALSDTHIFWIGADDNVWRYPKNGGVLEQFTTGISGLNNIEVGGTRLFMATDNEIKVVLLSCSPLPCSSPSTVDVSLLGLSDSVEVEHVTYIGGHGIGGFEIFFTAKEIDDGNDLFIPRKGIGRTTCSNVWNGSSFVWQCTNYHLRFVLVDSVLSNVVEVNGNVYWEEFNPTNSTTYIYQMNTSGGAPGIIDFTSGLFFYGRLESDEYGVYYRKLVEGVKRYTVSVPTRVGLLDSSIDKDHNLSVIAGTLLLLTGATILVGRSKDSHDSTVRNRARP